MVLRENQGGIKVETVVTNKINEGLYKIDSQLTNNNGGIPRILHSLGGGGWSAHFYRERTKLL